MDLTEKYEVFTSNKTLNLIGYCDEQLLLAIYFIAIAS